MVSGLKDRMAAALKDESKGPPIMRTLGMRIVQLGEGRANMALKADKRFHNPMGTLHGGVMTGLADACMGVATKTALAEDESFTTRELRMNFLRSVYEGELTAEARVVHRGRTVVMTEVAVRNQDGKDVARGTATQMVLRGTK